MTNLSVGLIDDDIEGKVLREILSHQGVLFEDIKPERRLPKKLPCVVFPTFSNGKYELAKKNCLSEKGIVVADEYVSLEELLRRFTGECDSSGESFLPADVNEMEHVLLDQIKAVFFDQGLPFLNKCSWPDSHRTCCVLTHDVDWLHYSPWHRAVFRRRSVPQLARLVYNSLFHKKDFGNNIADIVKTEKDEDVRSSFYFQPRYEENSAAVPPALKLLRDRNFEIGLHGYYAHRSLEKLRTQKQVLEKRAQLIVRGIRQHGAQFTHSLTWRHEAEAGFAYDLTVHSNEKFGFRAGTCFPYHLFDRERDTRLRMLELPTSIIDWTILFQRLSVEDALKQLRKVEAVVESYGGLLLACFHNTYMNNETFPEIVEIYASLLDDVHQKDYWVATAMECCQWWLKRENARVAARLVNRSVVGETSAPSIPLQIETSEGVKVLLEVHEASFNIDLNNQS